MTPSNENYGTGYDSPTPAAPDADLPATDAREDFATDPAETLPADPVYTAPPPASAPPTGASTAQDGPKDPEPAAAPPEAPTAPETPFVACPELHPEHPARLPPAARPIRQG